MSLYSKFNCNCNGKVDCRAYFDNNGKWQRVGGNELNNVQKAMNETDVMNERIKLGVPFASLKTEQETMAGVHSPE